MSPFTTQPLPSFNDLLIHNKTTANTATQLGWINEFDGLERQVVTGRVDMNSGIACPAADSQVITWGADIGATVSGRTFPQLIVDTMFGLADIAERAGLAGTRWIIVMPFRMFRPLTYVYACQYWTSLCLTAAWFKVMQSGIYSVHFPATWKVQMQSCKEQNAQSFAGQHARTSTSWYWFDEASRSLLGW